FKRTGTLIGFNYLSEGGIGKVFFDAKVAFGGASYFQSQNAFTDTSDGIFGSSQDDWLRSSNFKAVTLFGDKGNDRLEGGPQYDVLDGGEGIDQWVAGDGDDTIYFDAADLLHGIAGFNLDGGPGYDFGILTDPYPGTIDLAALRLEGFIGNV